MRVLVVGAGIAGLTAAFRLRQAGHEVRVLEEADHVGGRMVTVERDGYRMDVGASLLSSTYTRLTALAAEAGVADRLVEGHDALGIVRDGEVHRIRSSVKTDALRTRLLSVRGKLAAGRLLLDARRARDVLDCDDLSRAADLDTESVADYCARRLPRDTAEHLVAPIVRTINLSNVEDVSIVDLLFTLRYFLGGHFLTGIGGIDFLCRGLAAQLDVVLDASVVEVEPTASGVTVTWSRPGERERVEAADACVIALGAHAMAQIHRGLSDEAGALITSLEYADLMSVQLGLDRVPAESAVAYTLSRSEHADLCAVIFDHNKAPDRAPAGKGLLGTYWDPDWVRRHADDDDATVIEDAVAGVSSLVGEVTDHVELATVHRFGQGVLLSRPGTYGRLRRFHAADPPDSRIQVAGDFVGGSTTHSALCSGERAARRVQAALLSAARAGACASVRFAAPPPVARPGA